jgi:peptidoglycan/xylan/chitin deacetylase (PgdA/CDA1 family)
MYHRVINLPSDPWGLAVTPGHFAQHLETLHRYTHPIPLRQLARDLFSDDIEDRSVAITFDDGYADNLHNAKLLLEHYDMPATFFLTSGYIGGEREFWWDELERLFLQPGALPEVLEVSANGSTYQWKLGKAAHYSSEEAARRRRRWRIGHDVYRSRRRLYYSLWELLYSLREGERYRLLDKLRAWARIEPKVRATHRPLSLDEVVNLAKGELIEIGAHTVTHPALARLPATSQQDEILQSKARLEEILSRSVINFSYPHSSLSEETVDIVRKTGFTRACTGPVAATVVERSTDLLRLPRVAVQDWDGGEFARQLSRWFGG